MSQELMIECSFCHKKDKLKVATNGIAICDTCIPVVQDIAIQRSNPEQYTEDFFCNLVRIQRDRENKEWGSGFAGSISAYKPFVSLSYLIQGYVSVATAVWSYTQSGISAYLLTPYGLKIFIFDKCIWLIGRSDTYAKTWRDRFPLNDNEAKTSLMSRIRLHEAEAKQEIEKLMQNLDSELKVRGIETNLNIGSCQLVSSKQVFDYKIKTKMGLSLVPYFAAKSKEWRVKLVEPDNQINDRRLENNEDDYHNSCEFRAVVNFVRHYELRALGWPTKRGQRVIYSPCGHAHHNRELLAPICHSALPDNKPAPVKIQAANQPVPVSPKTLDA